MQTVTITLTVAGTDTGPFDLYSDADGYTTPFESGIAKAALVLGYTSVLVPDAATIIRVQSDSACTNFVDLDIVTTTTTTTSTTTSSTTTSTTTSTTSTTSTTTTETPIFEVSVYATLSEVLGGGGAQVEYSSDGVIWNGLGAGFNEASCSLRGTVSGIVSGSTLYLRLVVGVASPVEFGFIQGSNVCPSASNNCVASFVVTSTQDAAITGNVVAGSPIGC